jgi:hypothetical protein
MYCAPSVLRTLFHNSLDVVRLAVRGGRVAFVCYEVSANSNTDLIGILLWGSIIEDNLRVSPFVACFPWDINLVMCHYKH